jgi:dolichol kinase
MVEEEFPAMSRQILFKLLFIFCLLMSQSMSRILWPCQKSPFGRNSKREQEKLQNYKPRVHLLLWMAIIFQIIAVFS